MPQHAGRADAERGNDAAPPLVPPGYFSPPQPPPGYESAAPPAVLHPGFAMPLMAPALPLAWPLRGASPVEAVIRFFRKFATFNGRASRSEFWWVQLISVLLLPTAAIFGAFTDMRLLASMYALFIIACIVPYLALCVRRLHDANMSGSLLALWLIPYVGAFVVLILLISPSSNGGARFDTAVARSPLARNGLR